jgi:hypothetical protein
VFTKIHNILCTTSAIAESQQKRKSGKHYKTNLDSYHARSTFFNWPTIHLKSIFIHQFLYTNN